MHKIESLVSFLNLSDEILIKKINNRNHKVKFVGKFSRKIPENNTITNLLYLLDDKKKLKNQKYLIKVKKNIPQKSGLGGGSMNAASVLKYFLKKQKIKLNTKDILQIISKIGSDVILGMNQKNSIIYRNRKLKIIKKNLNLFTLLVKPSYGCSTKDIYKGIKKFSSSNLKNIKKSNLNTKFIIKLNNDLEKSAFKKYPNLKKLKIFMEKIENILFVRMTGSGATIIGYFNSKKAAVNAAKLLMKNYKNYWCNLSKTI